MSRESYNKLFALVYACCGLSLFTPFINRLYSYQCFKENAEICKSFHNFLMRLFQKWWHITVQMMCSMGYLVAYPYANILLFIERRNSSNFRCHGTSKWLTKQLELTAYVLNGTVTPCFTCIMATVDGLLQVECHHDMTF